MSRGWPVPALIGLLAFGTGPIGQAQEPPPLEPDAPVAEPPPTWRWKLADRPVKVVVLAGSIGAWPKQPYAERIQKLDAEDVASLVAWICAAPDHVAVGNVTVWPRAASSAELFWTGPGGNVSAALPRLHDVSYRFRHRGVKTISLQPEWCALRPGSCDLTA